MGDRMGKKRTGIRIKPGNKGKLRKTSSKRTKSGNIPASELQRLKKSPNPKTRRRANFALNARKWAKGGGKKRS